MKYGTEHNVLVNYAGSALRSKLTDIFKTVVKFIFTMGIFIVAGYHIGNFIANKSIALRNAGYPSVPGSGIEMYDPIIELISISAHAAENHCIQIYYQSTGIVSGAIFGFLIVILKLLHDKYTKRQDVLCFTNKQAIN